MNSIQINKMVIFKFYFIYSIPSLDLFDLSTRRLILLTKHDETQKRNISSLREHSLNLSNNFMKL